MDTRQPNRVKPMLGKFASGFTLIEILIAVAVLGILAAVALPSYTNYTRRAVVAEGLSLAQPALSKVREEVMFGGVPNKDGIAPLTPEAHIQDGSDNADPNPTPVSNDYSVVQHGLNVLINYSSKLDRSSPQLYTLVMAGRVETGRTVAFTCVAGPAAQPYLSAAQRDGLRAGIPLPLEWAPQGC